MFIGTPHRGADLSNILKGLLNVSFQEATFLGDLSPASQTIKNINHSFGERIEGIKLASFWESVGMPAVGVRP